MGIDKSFSVGFQFDPTDGITASAYGASHEIGGEWKHVIDNLSPAEAYQANFAARENWSTAASFQNEVAAIVAGEKKYGASPRHPEGDGHIRGSYKRVSPNS